MLLRIALLAGAALLSVMIAWAMGTDGRSLGAVLAAMLAEPWTAVTLADLYLGFFVSAAIILIAEKRVLVGLFWALPTFVLGNLWTALWLALRFPSLKARLRGGT